MSASSRTRVHPACADSAPAAQRSAGTASSRAQTLLRAGDWTGLQQHFSQHAAASADEFVARALLLTRAERTRERTAQILADWRQACALQPAHPLHAVNLAQALLDAGQKDEAVQLTSALVQRLPESYPAAEKHALALHACGHWAEAAAAGARAVQAAAAAGVTPSEATRAIYADLALPWWQPLHVGGALLRLPSPGDEDFLRGLFNDPAFMRRFHRYQSGDDHALNEFIHRGRRPPRAVRRRDWIVVDRRGSAAGVAAIVDIDVLNRRGELLIGIREPRSGESLALKASVSAITFAFEQLKLEKLVSYVYGDNPSARANTLHLGFRDEGALRSHLKEGTDRLDLYVSGLLKVEFEADARMQRMRSRWAATEPQELGTAGPCGAT
jgi:RimJ/RimL family protein N-acetyltransferase